MSQFTYSNTLRATPRFSNENKYDAYIASACARYAVPVSVIKGIIAKESGFSETARKPEPQYRCPLDRVLGDASIGLMQILRCTALGVGYNGTAEGLFHPQVNIEYGVKHFASLLRQYGDLQAAIAAYNGGGAAAKRQQADAINGFGLGGTDRYYFKAGEFGNQPYVHNVLDYASNYGYTGAVPPVSGKVNVKPSGAATGGAASPTSSFSDVVGGSSSTAPLLPPATLGPAPSSKLPTYGPPVVSSLPEPTVSTKQKVSSAVLALIGATLLAILKRRK